ncbi:MAG: transposase [bacterium]|nr:transposase [bacterium]MDI1335524.1 transposase [Lacunisphaera sp.]
MALTPRRGHEALRRGRWSMPGAEYFITLCTQNRKPGLSGGSVLEAILAEASRLNDEGVWHLRTLVVMPDHVHLLAVVSDSMDLTAAVRLFKGRLAPKLRKSDLHWQQAYFDHRVRSQEDCLPVFLYIYLNPYRADLLRQDERWPGYYCAEEDWVWFGALTHESLPMPEWLA